MNKHQPVLLKLSLCGTLLLPGFVAANDTTDPTEPPGTPMTCISLLKEVSPDGMKPWYDANTEAEAVEISNSSKFRLRPYNCGTEKLVNVHITDPMLAIDNYIGGMRPDNDSVFEFPAADICKDRYGLVKNVATASGTGEESAKSVEASDAAWVNCGTEPPKGGEGCTPGYWKQEQHFDSWPYGITPDQAFSSVFDREISVKLGKTMTSDPTLLQALQANGGSVNAAARHAVAAYLNGASTGVDYDLSAADVVAMFQANYPDGELEDMKDGFEKLNEQGCPLN